MALKIQGTPNKISVLGDLHEVSEGPKAKAALVRASQQNGDGWDGRQESQQKQGAQSHVQTD